MFLKFTRAPVRCAEAAPSGTRCHQSSGIRGLAGIRISNRLVTVNKAEKEHYRIVSLQLQKLSMLFGMTLKLLIKKDGARKDL
jgi:hypothetical protein